MAVTPLKDIVDPALAARYGVPAINILNDLTLEGVLPAAVQENSPLIVQTSVKTVRSIGAGCCIAMWTSMTAGIEVPVSLHLDHCPDRDVITECLELGWNSVLFDASQLPVAENQRQTVEVVAQARRYGAHVEGEIESITGVEDGIGSDTESARQTLDVSIEFIRATGVDVFAPAIGNAHGVYNDAPSWTPNGSPTWWRPPGPRRPARRQRTDRRAIQRPDRRGLREGEHLHGAQAAVHAVEPGFPAGCGEKGDSGIRRRCSRPSAGASPDD